MEFYGSCLARINSTDDALLLLLSTSKRIIHTVNLFFFVSFLIIYGTSGNIFSSSLHPQKATSERHTKKYFPHSTGEKLKSKQETRTQCSR
jgi:hypothetical protein